jgi:hypothetical protein
VSSAARDRPAGRLDLWEVLLPEVKRLSAELVKIDASLDDERPASAAVGGGGLERPQEGVIDQYRSLPGRDRDGRVIGPVTCYGGVDRGRPGEALVGGGLHQRLLVVEPIAGVDPGQHQGVGGAGAGGAPLATPRLGKLSVRVHA